jgi:hypothetical protein
MSAQLRAQNRALGFLRRHESRILRIMLRRLGKRSLLRLGLGVCLFARVLWHGRTGAVSKHELESRSAITGNLPHLF